ncbi:MAG TPA: XRE family transcriptional regulator [Phycisphaerae bacterium]|nr:XRE family transcriptional regulator [Phycisphaerae bacterium]
MVARYRPSQAFSGHIGQRIRYYRQKLGMNQTVLAHKAKVNQGFLSEIERGRRNPSPASIKAIALALDVPPAVLIGPGPDHDSPQPLLTRDLPLLGAIPAGPPAESQQQFEMFPVLRHLWSPDRYILRLSFDSMEPTLKPGDLVLVEYRPGVKAVHVQGRICACLIDGMPTLKRVSVERRGKSSLVILRGDNPDVPPIVVDETHEFSIQGVVTHVVDRAL